MFLNDPAYRAGDWDTFAKGFDMTFNHSRTVGDARKRLELAEAEQAHLAPFDVRPACRVAWGIGECGLRIPHTHARPIMADYGGSDPT